MKSTRLFSTFVCIISSAVATAQSEEVYLTTGDTLTGKIDILLPSEAFEEIILKTDGNKRRIKSFQMLGFKSDDKTYKIIKYGLKYRIMQEILDGYLGLYRFRSGNSYDFGSRFLYKATNEGMEVPNITFKKSVAEFVEECPDVQTAVKNKVYKGSNIEDMVKAFNECLDETPQYSDNEGEDKKSKKKDAKPSKELKLIQSISAKLKAEGIDEELVTLLDDIEGKIENGEKVPGYLTGALQESAGKYETVQKEVAALIEILK